MPPPAATRLRVAALFCVLGLAAVSRFATAQETITLDELDPQRDGWESEAFSDRAGAVLSQMGAWLRSSDPETAPEAFSASVSILGSAPRFDSAEIVTAGSQFTVRRFPDSREEVSETTFARLLDPIRERFAGRNPILFQFKTVESSLHSESDGGTAHLVEISGPAREGGMLETHSTWSIKWTALETDTPRLRSLRITDFEETFTPRGEPLFADATQDTLGDLPAWEGQLRFSSDHWQSRIENYFQIHLFGQRGLALGDVNGDGLDDLYVCQPGGLPNRLFLHRPDHGVQDISRSAGVDFLDNSNAALFADLDNDDDQDLVVTLSGGILFLEQSAPLRFVRRSLVENLADGQSVCAADYDRDGDLDLYVCSYYADSRAAGELALPVPYFDANNGGPNILFRNEGAFVFADATAEAGLDENNRRWSWAAMWADANGDGLDDLYVANDFGRNNLYVARAAPDGSIRFRDVADEAGLREGAFGMSVSAADFDRDGALDFYVGNMFSSAGSRITRQPGFHPEADADLRRRFQNLARGNTLFRGLSAAGSSDTPRFAEVGAASGVAVGRWSWSSPFTDFNNDGWEDLVVANGYVTGPSTADDL
jgi:hypothetical protein